MNEFCEIYFQFKPNIQYTEGNPIFLREVIEVSCDNRIKKQIGNIKIPVNKNKGTLVITAIDIINLISKCIPNASINLVGEGKSLIEPKNNKIPPKPKIFTAIKVLFSALIVFIGSATAIINFHADVNMHEAHKIIYTFIVGKEIEKPYILSIPYSIGIGIGIALFFDVVNIGKKKQNPGPLELEVYRYEKDMYSYIRDEEEKEGS